MSTLDWRELALDLFKHLSGHCGASTMRGYQQRIDSLDHSEREDLASLILAGHRANRPDPIVQCACGWFGKQSELVPGPIFAVKLCPRCPRAFAPVEMMTALERAWMHEMGMI